mmetsp:Transcript_8/g.21  ORF Transcript_8/g.21 Transcript_8/m.21 type:complete len:232 (+) Transcript_8:506-1201(+)
MSRVKFKQNDSAHRSKSITKTWSMKEWKACTFLSRSLLGASSDHASTAAAPARVTSSDDVSGAPPCCTSRRSCGALGPKGSSSSSISAHLLGRGLLKALGSTSSSSSSPSSNSSSSSSYAGSSGGGSGLQSVQKYRGILQRMPPISSSWIPLKRLMYDSPKSALSCRGNRCSHSSHSIHLADAFQVMPLVMRPTFSTSKTTVSPKCTRLLAKTVPSSSASPSAATPPPTAC